MMLESIKEQQSEILEKVYENRKPKRPRKLSGVLKTVLETSAENVLGAFGQFGSRILDFVSFIDQSDPHPELFDLFGGELVSFKQGSFGRLASDILKIHSYAKENSMSSELIQHLKDFICTNKNYININMLIDNPQKNLLHVRFVDSREKRDKIRLNKTFQLFTVHENLKCDDDFSKYYRGYSSFEDEINDAEYRLKHFKDLGLKMMSKEISNSLEELVQNSINSQTCGFNKIKIIDVYGILAKQSKKLNEINSNIRLYNHLELKGFLSQETCDVINRLENFPEIRGHSLFDHYKIVFFRKWDCSTTDFNLVKNKEVISILLGEKDGDFYFICYA